MSLAQPSAPEAELARGPSPASLNLSSNNPFRNRAASPVSSQQSPLSPDFRNRPVSRNPFLDVFDTTAEDQRPRSAGMDAPRSKEDAVLDEKSIAIFDKLEISDKPAAGSSNVGASSDRYLPTGQAPRPRPENVPPPNGQPPRYAGQPRLRPARPDLDSKSRQGSLGGPPRPRPGPPGPEREGERRRPRRNSDSSVRSAQNGMLSPDDKRRRERKDRIRRDEKAALAKPKRQNRQLDIIDKLDVTSIYGTGLFHHDGPFDACNPHRNRRKDHRAPMQAFPKDSANNVIGGSGPVNKTLDTAQFMGVSKDGEAFTDFSRSAEVQYGGRDSSANNRPSYERERDRAAAAAAFNPIARVDPVHGDETLGLGTSTFLEGAPASRTAIQRRESESDVRPSTSGGGLQRKKSLAQKIRGMGVGRQGSTYGNRVTSPEPGSGEIGYAITTSPQKAQSAGGPARLRAQDRGNPFFDGYDRAYDKKGASIAAAEEKARAEGGEAAPAAGVPQEDKIDVVRRNRAPSSPKARMGFGPILERRVTSGDAAPAEDPPVRSNTVGGGFLSRVKSLKGGKRAKPPVEKVEA